MNSQGKRPSNPQDREQQVIELGRRILCEEGFTGLQMEKVAALAGLSRGVIYKHFASKEELAARMLIDSMEQRAMLLRKASEFEGGGRERMLALIVAEEFFTNRNPGHCDCEVLIRFSGLLNGRGPEFQTRLHELESDMDSRFQGVIAQARAAGELPADCHSEDVQWSVVALRLGFQLLLCRHRDHQLHSPMLTLRHCLHRLLDGFRWEPLSHEFNYDEVSQNIMRFLHEG